MANPTTVRAACAALVIASGLAQSVSAQLGRAPMGGQPAARVDGDPVTETVSIASSKGVHIGDHAGHGLGTDTPSVLLPLGTAPEADEHAAAKFLPDGSGVVVANRRSQNLVIFNPSTRAVIKAIPLTQHPHALAINPAGTIAVTANMSDGTASIVNLGTGSEVVIPTGVYPGTALITPDGTRALIHNHGRVLVSDPYGKLTVINLSTNAIEREINGIGFSNISASITPEWDSVGIARDYLASTGPLVYDNSTVVFAAWATSGTTQALLININTGATVSVPVALNPRLATISGTKAYIAHTGTNNKVTIIDVPSALVDPGAPGAVTVITTPVGLTGSAAVNAAGDRLALSVSNNFGILNLTTQAFTNNVGPSGTVSALYTTHDGDHFVAASALDTITNFNGTVIQNFNATSQSIFAAISPVTDRVALFSSAYGEDMVLLDTTVNAVSMLSGGPTGPPPEADKPRRVAVNPAGTRAVTANVLSQTASVIDLTTRTVIATLPIQTRPGEVKITPNGARAVIASRDGTGADIIDLDTTTVRTVNLGAAPLRADGVVFSPDSQYAYVNAINVDGVYRIDLAAGTGGPLVATGNMGSISQGHAAFAGLAISPDGATVVTCNSTSNTLTFIQTSTMSVIATLNVATQPLRAVFSASGDRLYLASGSSNTFSTIDTTNPASPAVLGAASVASMPLEIRLNSAGTRAYVQELSGNAIAVVDISVTPPVVLTTWNFPVNSPAWAVQAMELSADSSKMYVTRGTSTLTSGNGTAYASDYGSFEVVDTATGSVIDSIATGRLATALAKDAADTVVVTTDIWYDAVTIIGNPPTVCYPNCDASTTVPVVNTGDFTCFLQQYSVGVTLPSGQQQTHYSNCNGSTIFPQVNTGDFTCFLQKYAAGCN
jgi:YVTN family beta-propeller protein